VAQTRALPEDEQRRSSGALSFTRDRHDYTYSMAQIEGIGHVERKQTRASFASEKRLRKISAIGFDGLGSV